MRRTTEEIREIVDNLGYKLLKEYTGKNNRRVIIKDLEGYKYDVQLNDIIRGHIPDFVNKNNPFVLDNISLWLKIENKPFLLCSDNIYSGALEKLFFKCLKKETCGEIFDAAWGYIYTRGDGCPFCVGKRVGKRNNLAYLRPELAAEWDYENNKRNPNEYTEFSTERVSWICSKCNYAWESLVSSRSTGNGCPACGRKVVTDRNRLSIVCPELVKEWHPTKNMEMKPEDFSYGSQNYIWWICSKCNHSWKSIIKDRSRGIGCPKCANSKKESNIANQLKVYFKENFGSFSEYQIVKNPNTGYWLPYDIYVPYGENSELNGFYIEVHWEQHYKLSSFHKMMSKRNGSTPEEEFEYQKYKDKIKKRFAKENGIYIEIDLRKIRTTDGAIEYIESIMRNTLSD